MPDYQIQLAEQKEEFEAGAKLFREYAALLKVDLCFQDFEKELTEIDKQYNLPGGALLLAIVNGQAVGCAGIRRLAPDACELKRMFVKPASRKLGLGVALLQGALEKAKNLGYKLIRLDTLPEMERAQNLYRQFGFYKIAPYRFNPVQGTVYMEKRLES